MSTCSLIRFRAATISWSIENESVTIKITSVIINKMEGFASFPCPRLKKTKYIWVLDKTIYVMTTLSWAQVNWKGSFHCFLIFIQFHRPNNCYNLVQSLVAALITLEIKQLVDSLTRQSTENQSHVILTPLISEYLNYAMQYLLKNTAFNFACFVQLTLLTNRT